MSYLVSVIMPAYNAEKYISQSIQSVINQTYSNWELIIVDDGSIDSTAETARNFSGVDRRIKYFFQKNGRQGKARNRGIRESSAELIAFLDADDLWESEKLALQTQVMQETKADLVFSDAFIFAEDEKLDNMTTFSAICPDFPRGKFEGCDIFKLLFAYNRIPILTVLTRKSVLHKVRCFDEDGAYQNCEDYDLWLKLARSGAVFFGMQEKLAKYRHHSTSMMNNDSRLLKPMLAVIKKHSQNNDLDEREVKGTVRSLYRNLISTLVEENKIDEARDYLKEFSEWNKFDLTTAMQRILLRIAPNNYNFISRECLYRMEWHLAKLSEKLTAV